MTSVHRCFDHRIFYKQCISQVHAGHEVVLVAPHAESGMFDGVKVRAIAKPAIRSARFLTTTTAVFKCALAEKADLYHFHDPELIPAGLVLKLLGRRVVYDIEEDTPAQILSKNWIPRLIRRPLAAAVRTIQRVGAKMFDAVIVAEPLQGKPLRPLPVTVVQNLPILSEFQPIDSRKYRQRTRTIVYVGGLTTIRGVVELVQAIGIIGPECQARVLLAGEFQEPGLFASVQRMHGWRYVEYLGWLSRSEVARLLAEARIGECVLHSEPNYINAYPVKLFEYMAAALPVVVSDFPLWRSIVEDAKCGLVVAPGDPKGLADAFRYLLTHEEEAAQMGRSGRDAVEKKYNWRLEEAKLNLLYDRLLNFEARA